MSLKRSMLKTAFCCVLLSYTGSCFALGAVSRACNFYWIPVGAQTVAARFFYALGADEFVLSLPNADVATQAQYWINESLTTDYGSVRYYLFAVRNLYQMQSLSSDYSSATYDYVNTL